MASSAVAIKREIEPIEQAEAKKRQAAAGPASGKGKKTASGKLPQAVKGRALDKVAKVAVPAPRDKAAADELSEVVAAIADATAQAEVAMRAKNADKLREAITTRARAERRAGALLVALAGRLRPLPGISKVQSKKYRRDAELSAEEFEAKLRRAEVRAVAAIGVAPKKPAPAKAKPTTRPQQAMKISDWREEPDGSRSRTLTAVDGGAEAT